VSNPEGKGIAASLGQIDYNIGIFDFFSHETGEIAAWRQPKQFMKIENSLTISSNAETLTAWETGPVRAPLEKSKLLDRGGKPTVRELLSSLVFNPVDGTIRLNGERIVMQRAAVGAELRRELIGLLGPQEARVFLIRLGFISGRADARFIRTRWPNLDVGDAFTAGTRLHTFSGVVRVETIFNEYDFRKKRFSAEFLWHDSAEAEEFRRHHRQSTEPVCWQQLGYACGYASEFFDTLILYKETECSAEGHPHCRVVGKPADVWGPGDPEVILFRERITASLEEEIESRRALTIRTAGAALSELDRIVLAPVRPELDRFAPMALPVLIEGAAGTGRNRAARYLHRASSLSGTALRQIDGAAVTDETCAEISRSVRGGRRGSTAETLVIDGVEKVPAGMQEKLARALEEGLLVGGPRVFALAASDRQGGLDPMQLRPALRYALSALTVRMPSLAERRSDRLAIAGALLSVLCARMRLSPPDFDASATAAIERYDWPGNIRELRAVLGAAMAIHRSDGPLTGKEIETQLDRLRSVFEPGNPDRQDEVVSWLDRAFAAGGFSMAELERQVYRSAVARTDGNLSAAARLVGLTRAQLAYRLGAADGKG
jgi:DNA-binding NtrC family response regulator